MKLRIPALDSRRYHPLRWQGGDSRMLWLIYGTFSTSLSVKANARPGLSSAYVPTGNVQLNYNQRPTGRPMEIINLEGSGKRNLVETGFQ